MAKGKKRKQKKGSPTGLLCRVCGQDVAPNPNGTVKLHNAQGRNGVVPCPGSGLKVAAPGGKPPTTKIRGTPHPPDPKLVAKRTKELLNPSPRNTQGDDAAAENMRSGGGTHWRLGRSPRHNG